MSLNFFLSNCSCRAIAVVVTGKESSVVLPSVDTTYAIPTWCATSGRNKSQLSACALTNSGTLDDSTNDEKSVETMSCL